MYVKITPNAGEAAIKGMFADADGKQYLRISVVSVPEKGKANKELIKFLSKELKIPKSLIAVASGETSHLKKIALNTTAGEVISKLEEWNKI